MAAAQKVESVTPWDVGDKASYTWVLGPKTLTLDEEVTESGAGTVKLVNRTAQRSFDVVVQWAPLRVTAGPCLSNGQQCTFGEGIVGFDLPAEKGRKWSTTFNVTGETFTADVVQERVVDRLEKVKTPAGEFETFKVNFVGRIKGKDAKGASFTGKEDGSEWFAILPSGKLVLVKVVYRNSFGEKAAREIRTLAFR